MIKQFDERDIEEISDSEIGKPFFFTCAMVSTCEPLLDDCGDNYEVASRLKAAGVIMEDDDEDSESCQLWVNFTTREQGNHFINRLNSYLRLKAAKIKEAKEF